MNITTILSKLIFFGPISFTVVVIGFFIKVVHDSTIDKAKELFNKKINENILKTVITFVTLLLLYILLLIDPNNEYNDINSKTIYIVIVINSLSLLVLYLFFASTTDENKINTIKELNEKLKTLELKFDLPEEVEFIKLKKLSNLRNSPKDSKEYHIYSEIGEKLRNSKKIWCKLSTGESFFKDWLQFLDTNNICENIKIYFFNINGKHLIEDFSLKNDKSIDILKNSTFYNKNRNSIKVGFTNENVLLYNFIIIDESLYFYLMKYDIFIKFNLSINNSAISKEIKKLCTDSISSSNTKEAIIK